MTTGASAPAGPALAGTIEPLFATKTSCDVDATMAFFAPDISSYIDATLGWDLAGWETLKGVFAQYMPGWGPPARSYATRTLAGERSTLVHMVDTPELFGGELRILAAIDTDDEGGVIRWVDYWDSSAIDDGSTRSSVPRTPPFRPTSPTASRPGPTPASSRPRPPCRARSPRVTGRPREI